MNDRELLQQVEKSWPYPMSNALLEDIRARLSKPEQEPILKVYRGELCYKSKDDDQSYGMWCPVGDDTFPEGTRFYTAPPQRQPLTDEEELRGGGYSKV